MRKAEPHPSAVSSGGARRRDRVDSEDRSIRVQSVGEGTCVGEKIHQKVPSAVRIGSWGWKPSSRFRFPASIMERNMDAAVAAVHKSREFLRFCWTANGAHPIIMVSRRR